MQDKITIADAPDCLNTNDKAMWVLGYQAALAAQAAQHPDDAAVDALAALMKAKLAKQRAKGYGGWDTDCTRERLSELLRGHVDKGDPVDVANFCAFLSARGEGIAPQAQADERDAERYRFIVSKKLILSGGTEQFGWPIAPFGSECDRYIDAAMAAAKGEQQS